MWLRSASTISCSLALLCALPFLSGCDSIPIYAGGRTLAAAECEAIRSDRERGVISTAWDPAICERKDKERIEEARKIVREADKQQQDAEAERLAEARKLVEAADKKKAAENSKGGGL
jgi:hypothetical protein